jgi:tetratricopeptide (TPR) repeat protein
LAYCNYLLENKDIALNSISRAIDLNPNNADLYRNRGLYNKHWENLEGAEKDL